MAMNPNWPRWILASVSDHFSKAFEPLITGNIADFHIEGIPRTPREDRSLYELRMDGPRGYESTKGEWTLRVELNILIQTAMKEAASVEFKEFHEHHRNMGRVQEAFVNISVFRYGPTSDPVNDQTFLGCLKLIQDKSSRDFLECNNFGQIDTSVELQQATIEGHYEMCLIV